jgi:hypothetical protein
MSGPRKVQPLAHYGSGHAVEVQARVFSVPSARARSNPPPRFFVQDEEKGLVVLQMARDHQNPSKVCGSDGAQSPDDGLRVALDDGQVGPDGDLRPPAALLPVLERPHIESKQGGEVRLR